MIFRTLCNTCLQPYEIRAEPSDVELLRQVIAEDFTVACPRLCGGKISLSNDQGVVQLATHDALRQPLHLSGAELYKAVNGAGLPDEIPTSPEAIEALLLAHRVEKVSLKKDGRHLYLDELQLANGSIVHLTAGQRGALVLKLTRRT